MSEFGKVAVFGAGSWGTAFSIVLADAGNDVTIWARREEVATAINERRENADYLPSIELPPSVRATHDVEAALDGADLVVEADSGTGDALAGLLYDVVEAAVTGNSR